MATTRDNLQHPGGVNRLIKDTGVDANAASNTSTLILKGATKIGVYVEARTGTNAAHILTLQVSPDDSAWFDTSATMAQLVAGVFTEVSARFARVRVSTLEGAVSTIDITLIATN